ncbi:unnamed protein product [Musa textilis]
MIFYYIKNNKLIYSEYEFTCIMDILIHMNCSSTINDSYILVGFKIILEYFPDLISYLNQHIFQIRYLWTLVHINLSENNIKWFHTFYDFYRGVPKSRGKNGLFYFLSIA